MRLPLLFFCPLSSALPWVCSIFLLQKGSWSFWTSHCCTNAGNFYIFSIRLENGKWVVYYSYYSLKVCVKTVPCFTMWYSAVAQGLREAMSSTLLLFLHVCVSTQVCVVFRIPTGITWDPPESFSSGIKVILPLCVLAISLWCVWPSAPAVHNATLSQLPQLFPFPRVSTLIPRSQRHQSNVIYSIL